MRQTSGVKTINIDNDRTYEYDGYNEDFGPLTLSQIHKYCQEVDQKLKSGTVVHHCSNHYAK